MEKIKNYNQKLLAILGTIVVLMAAMGLILVVFFVITEISREVRYNRPYDGILSDERIEELQKENKRQQVISYDFPRLVDTLNAVYIIPVRQKTLKEAEYIDEGLLGLMNLYESEEIDARYSKSYYGSFNNLLIFDVKENSLTTLFDERINFNEIRTEIIGDEIMILFSAALKDTNKDGVINLRDLKSLYIYSLADKRLRKISEDNMDVLNYDFVYDTKDLLISFGIDYNKDGYYNSSFEPSVIKKYDFTGDQLVDIIDNETNIQLQKLLEGSN